MFCKYQSKLFTSSWLNLTYIAIFKVTKMMYLLAVAALISSSNAFHGRMATKFVRSAQLSMSTATVVPTETILSTVRAK